MLKNLPMWNLTYIRWNSHPVTVPEAVNTARDPIRNSYIFSYKETSIYSNSSDNEFHASDSMI